jgi:hypothetical protein
MTTAAVRMFIGPILTGWTSSRGDTMYDQSLNEPWLRHLDGLKGVGFGMKPLAVLPGEFQLVVVCNGMVSLCTTQRRPRGAV